MFLMAFSSSWLSSIRNMSCFEAFKAGRKESNKKDLWVR